MTAPIYSNVVVNFSNQVDTLTRNFIFNGYAALSNALAQPLAALSVLFIVLTGYGITRGIIKHPMSELVKFSIRLGIIYFFAMNWSHFSTYVMGLFIKGSSELSVVLMKSSSLVPQPLAGDNIIKGLQSVFTEVIRAGAMTIKKTSFKNLGPLFSALMIYLSGIAVTGIALMELIVAKLMMSVCLVTAPFFITLTLFDKTRAFFDRWLGLLIGFSLVSIFVSSVVGLCMSLIHWTVSDYADGHSATIDSVGWIPICLISCFCVAALSQAAHIAKSIGASCHTAGGSDMVTGMIGKAAGVGMIAKKLYGKYRGSKNGAAANGLLKKTNGDQVMQNIQQSLIRGEA
jgi:type IV secretion system protein VirB6